MEGRRCATCGKDPGAGAFCQHCGTNLASTPPTDAGDIPAEHRAGSPPEPSDAIATTDPTPGTPPTPGQPPPPQVVYVQAPSGSAPQPASGSKKGCRIGCGVTALVVLLVVAAAAYFGWQWYQATVTPTIEGIGTAFEEGLGGFVEDGDSVGPCYDLEFDGDGIVTEWADVDCGGSRDAEVFHRWTFRDGSFPGAEALADEAFETCVVWFEDYVGVPYIDSTLRIDWLVPTATLWADGDRSAVCTVGAVRGPLTGPVKGSAR